MMERLEHANLCVHDIDAVVRFLMTAFPDFTIRKDAMDPDGSRWVHVGNDETYIALNQAKPGLRFSAPVEAVVMRGLSKEPVKRYADVIAFAQDFCEASQQPAEQEKTGFGAKFASMFRKKS